MQNPSGHAGWRCWADSLVQVSDYSCLILAGSELVKATVLMNWGVTVQRQIMAMRARHFACKEYFVTTAWHLG